MSSSKDHTTGERFPSHADFFTELKVCGFKLEFSKQRGWFSLGADGEDIPETRRSRPDVTVVFSLRKEVSENTPLSRQDASAPLISSGEVENSLLWKPTTLEMPGEMWLSHGGSRFEEVCFCAAAGVDVHKWLHVSGLPLLLRH